MYWVRLARLPAGASAASIEEEIAHAVMETDFSPRSGWEAIIGALSGTDGTAEAVLVMDNCEHVLEAVGEVIDQLLAAAPNLSIVATSRGTIGWTDEYRVSVPPLSVDQAVELFRLRSELVGRPSAGLGERELIAEICDHLDNHPLYIRLAAARLTRKPLSMILDELSGEPTDRRMQWSDAPRVGSDTRHRGVRDVVAWSYELCEEPEQILFERMAVFAAGYEPNPEDAAGGAGPDIGADREAIIAVCSDSDDANASSGVTPETIPDLLDRLVDQSLVAIHLTPTTVRYSLLESIRVYAQYRLTQRSHHGMDERARLEHRHLRYYRDKLAAATANWSGPGEREYLDWARAAWGNILTALERSVADPEHAGLALEICWGLLEIRWPFLGCSFREIRLWSDRALAATQQHGAAEAVTGRDRNRELADRRLETIALLTRITICQGAHEDAAAMLDECVRICLGDDVAQADWRAVVGADTELPAAVECAWGFELLIVKGDPRSLSVLERATAKYYAAGNIGRAVAADLFVALAAGVFGSDEAAEQTTARYLERVRDLGASWARSWAQLARAVALTRLGRPNEALRLERAALDDMIGARNRWGELWAIQFRMCTLASIVERLRVSRADRTRVTALSGEIGHLAGGIETVVAETSIDISGMGPFSASTSNAIGIAREALGAQAFAGAVAEGRKLRVDRDELQSLAMGRIPLGRTAPEPGSVWTELSDAESTVAVLAAAGWTNTQIAVRRGSSIRTVDSQVASVLRKLSISAREQIVDLVPRDLRDRVRAEVVRRPGRQPRSAR
ncbi:ATP-binding protein [Nocardia neocaledoniensis]|uniref:Putative ATPase n=1 Tax=Nocardia neocaledoniensis TaxID=236511 RepID=A0A317NI02_9NOCA|nr:LuxR C-terminal-related transcriptional regulator [Nocardia neocaledoniensis]PWV74523.1 putative ATPase [Nocardia neocaledoniensis]